MGPQPEHLRSNGKNKNDKDKNININVRTKMTLPVLVNHLGPLQTLLDTSQILHLKTPLDFQTSQMLHLQTPLDFQTSRMLHLQTPLDIQTSRILHLQTPLDTSRILHLQTPLDIQSSRMLHLQGGRPFNLFTVSRVRCASNCWLDYRYRCFKKLHDPLRCICLIQNLVIMRGFFDSKYLKLNGLACSDWSSLPLYGPHSIMWAREDSCSFYAIMLFSMPLRDYRVVELLIPIFSMSSPTLPSTNAVKFSNDCSSLALHDSADSPPICGISAHRGKVNQRRPTRSSSGYITKSNDENLLVSSLFSPKTRKTYHEPLRTAPDSTTKNTSAPRIKILIRLEPNRNRHELKTTQTKPKPKWQKHKQKFGSC
ncbi:hypothetical protein EDB19DRAFT_265553 [Suillus lakei]|nr:hypothetical protein EDB19DRAFT_265553 [Suillus lakei]